ncbi:alpha-(1,3)-fucosyltransferase C-like [Aricia agestis]|uniref:alpha-(1,3)-fucosyltransferase C-like n=1 Tax=Aricia agestis TaxID=91739 RepID=UPI001C20A7FB|nr:alpha-(1,3)-fucosyltransferase C-like [Aricia agestis]
MAACPKKADRLFELHPRDMAISRDSEVEEAAEGGDETAFSREPQVEEAAEGGYETDEGDYKNELGEKVVGALYARKYEIAKLAVLLKIIDNGLKLKGGVDQISSGIDLKKEGYMEIFNKKTFKSGLEKSIFGDEMVLKGMRQSGKALFGLGLDSAYAIALNKLGDGDQSIEYGVRRPSITVLQIERFVPDMKNILIWTDLSVRDSGQREFLDRRCKYNNCFITKNRTLFGDVRYFDAVLFDSAAASEGMELPEARGTFQKYIFVATASADDHPVCDPVYDDFFNWTWTYRYDSTITYRFFTIFNAQYEELGSNFRWYSSMGAVDDAFKSQFSTKSKAAAVFLDRCYTPSQREKLIHDLQMDLAKYNLTVDIFGKCGEVQCKTKNMKPCLWRLKKTYYFYLAFEDSMSFDYITDIALYAYNNNAVPIVYGGAQYERYLPPGSYINAYNTTTESLAAKMFHLMSNRDAYFDNFRFRNHYFFSKVEPLDLCRLCETLNNPASLVQKVTYYNFRRWWNPSYDLRCLIKKYGL